MRDISRIFLLQRLINALFFAQASLYKVNYQLTIINHYISEDY